METRTYDEALDLVRAMFRSYITEGPDLSEGADYDITARILAALFTGNQAQAEFIAAQLFPATAEAAFVDLHATARALDILPATKAEGRAVILGTTAGLLQPVGSQLTHDDGTTFETLSDAVTVEPAWSGKTVITGSGEARILVAPDTSGIAAGDIVEINGEVRAVQGVQETIGAIDLWEPLLSVPSGGLPIEPRIGVEVTIRATESGPGGNKLAGEILTLDSPVSGIDDEVRITRISGGADLETTEGLRRRVIALFEQSPGNGNAAELRKVARAQTEYRFDDALVFPGLRGFGTVDVVPLGPSGARLVTQAQIDALQAVYDDSATYVDDILVRSGTLTSEQEVTVTITPEVGYEPDFVKPAGFNAQTGSTTTHVLLDSSPVGIVEVGDRVLIAQQVGSVWVTSERTVVGLGASYLDLDAALPVAPTLNASRPDVYPSGPNGLALVRAVEGVFDALGAGTGTGGTLYRRFPAVSSAWDPVLRLSRIYAALQSVEGVRGVTPTSIGGTTPADIEPAALEFVRQGQITIKFA